MFISSAGEGQAGGTQTINPSSSHVQYTARDLGTLDFRSYHLMHILESQDAQEEQKNEEQNRDLLLT